MPPDTIIPTLTSTPSATPVISITPVPTALNPLGPVTLPQFGFTSLNQAINTLLPAIFLLAGLITFFYLFLAAFKFMTSGGSDEGRKSAATIYKNLIIGLLLLAMIFVLWRFIVNLIPGMNQYFQ